MIESNLKKDLEYKIDLYINGKLNQEEIDGLWAELIQDGYYLDYTKSVANLKAVIESKRNTKKSAPVYRLRKVINYGAAAAIAIIIGVVSVFNYTSTTTTGELTPLEQLDLDNIRGPEDNPAANSNQVIKDAIELANNGNFEDAITLIQTALVDTDTPELVAEMSLTLGSIQYNYGEYEAAVLSFERIVSQATVDIQILEKGYWYLANTYLQLDRLLDAEAAFQKTLDMDGQYSRIAKTNLEALKSVR